ncbi:MAG: hypothetical protein A2X32_01930 [Elusimicrobia bacterium GWC2_64_44]|nr:MAG: hypothetical protein A2X32_01930 [Elusimicrobia bacterium GWC2_64_44]
MKSALKITAYAALFAAGALAAAYYTLPVNRINMRSRLVMLGDFNGDNKWDQADAALLGAIAADPFSLPADTVFRADVNHNGLLDEEDLYFLGELYKTGDPYKTRDYFTGKKRAFPYPRDFFRYVPETEYIQRPVLAIEHPAEAASPLRFLGRLRVEKAFGYREELLREIYSEGIRFSLAYARRLPGLLPKEKEYSAVKIARCAALWKNGSEYELLLELMGLIEDAETLTVRDQPEFVAQSLYFRDHLREVLESKLYKDYSVGKAPAGEVFKAIEAHLLADMGIKADLANIAPPRDYKALKNYLDRARWQFYKSSASRHNFRRLLLFAQYDRRYLRAAARTTRKMEDAPLENHNLPMVLLFRRALEIKGGDKRAAVGLIDEAVRVPFAWVKVIPREKLPASVALENFLLPGNKEDGSDKSRHWNVFGGISLYKSPEESLRLALAREVKDFRDNPSPHAMTEFIRDTMANLNGIYYVVSIKPDLLAKK